MKLFRLLTLTLAIGVFPAFLMQAQGQQEVDPDHYDQPAAVQVNAHGSKAQGDHKIANAHQGQNHTRLASKHSGKANHHRAHVFRINNVRRLSAEENSRFLRSGWEALGRYDNVKGDSTQRTKC